MSEKDMKEMGVGELRTYANELRSEYLELPSENRSDEQNTRVRGIKAEVDKLDTLMSLALVTEMREYESQGALAALGQVGEGVRSGGQQFLDHPDVVEWIRRGLPASGFRAELDAGIRVFEAYDWAASTGPGNASPGSVNTLLPVAQPIAPTPRQAKLYLRDLIPTMTTTMSRLPYVRELTPTSTELGASAVLEAGTKPDQSLNFQGATADPTVIAATLTLSKQLFEDASFVVQYINQRLPYLVKFKEDYEFLNGSGTWPDLTGILNTSGVQSQSATSGDPAVTIANAMAKIQVVDGQATAVVMYPTDATTMFVKRASTSGIFDAGTPFANMPMSVWGLPVYQTRAMTQGHALVADFQRGAIIADRQQVTIETFDQHSDYAARNMLFLRCEERVGLLVPRPDVLVNATL